MPKTYSSKLLSQRQVAEGTTEFTLEKPVGSDFAYVAGQFGDIVLPHAADNTDKMSYTHGFSFVSAPFEERLRMATRMRNSAFKNAIAKLPDGTALEVMATWGKFTLHDDAKLPALFIAGGIGVTPALSIIQQATHDKAPHRITLLTSNRSTAREPYKEELKALAAQNPRLTLASIHTQAQGHVTTDAIRKYAPDLAGTMFYVSGPDAFVKSLRGLLTALGVDRKHIRSEGFEGY
ncbi:MAG TPA: FAD-dependent oxidoreductase [Nevskiaceae bacterium]|nr:FAD-dependent oxidoreductase [Nevskiaceae bacterium]